MNTLLTQAGYWPNPATKTWAKPGYDGISYSDGDEVETRIASIVDAASNLSVLSPELSRHLNDWPSLYHLSATRSNILRPFRALLEGAEVLEIGAGCGAITRYLGECGAKVLALEGTTRRAAIARARTRDLPNIEVVADRFDDFQSTHKFDVITLIGVLEYANLFTSGPNPAVSMLTRARAMLKPTGKLIIAIENQLGLKYFAGAPEDHLGGPMYGIEARYRADQPQTFGRKVLGSLLDKAGFDNAEFFAPFPDYKLPVSIITEKGMACSAFDASALAWQSVRRDPQLPKYLNFAPELVWESVTKNGIALDLANSFLVLASNIEQKRSDVSVLAYHFSTERAEVYCKETRFVQTASDTIELHYQGLASKPSHNVEGTFLKFKIQEKATYIAGTVLSKELIDVVTRDGWRIEDVGAFLQRFLHIATCLSSVDGKPLLIESSATILPGICFDLVPQNIVICPDGQYHAIDKEWELREGICAGWLVFRTLLLLVQAVTRFGNTDSVFTRTRLGFFIAAFHNAGIAATFQDIHEFGTMEASAQAEVSRRPLEQLLNWWSDSALPFHSLNHALTERDGQIAELDHALTERDGRIAGLNHVLTERDRQIAGLNHALTERDGQIAGLNHDLTEHSGQIAGLRNDLTERDGQIVALNHALSEHDGQIARLNQAMVERDGQIRALTGSRSWRSTASLRWVGRALKKATFLQKIKSRLQEKKVKRSKYFDTAYYLTTYPDVAKAKISPIRHYLEYGWREGRDPSSLFSTRIYLDNNPDVAIANVNPLIHFVCNGQSEGRASFSRLTSEIKPRVNIAPAVSGRVSTALRLLVARPDLISRFVQRLKREGVHSALAAVALYVRRGQRQQALHANTGLVSLDVARTSRKVRHVDLLIPLYLNPFRSQVHSDDWLKKRVLICISTNSENSCSLLLDYLHKHPWRFDLRITVLDSVSPRSINNIGVRSETVQSINVRDGAKDPSVLHGLLCMLAEEVNNYDVIGYFNLTHHTDAVNLSSGTPQWAYLLKTQSNILEIFDLLCDNARVIMSSFDWRMHLRNALSPSSNLTNDTHDSFLHGHATLAEQISEAKMIWLDGRLISKPSLEAWATAIAASSITNDKMAAVDELTNLIKQYNGRDYVLFDAQSDPPTAAFENQIDYSHSVRQGAVKVLAFYLPQFHPTPENDEWHGKGFTEWHKVRAANPLFHGHYQQHAPHPDLGYYDLDSTQVLMKQLAIMKKGGVHGQIFYHYWFAGRLILEKAAQMLLVDKTIDMQFCFCWANENWTRRWDGNEQEILLGQKYGPDDAAGFIRYLIPFFKDDRYISIDGRPVLFIYRPSSIEHLDEYRAIWNAICRDAGLREPYLVATLTRGAMNPNDFGMDAGCERVLHDWTDGAVRERKNEVVAYRPIDGTVLDYNDVANFYMAQSHEKEFTYFRSIIPIWDNTARYESRAYVVNASSPEKFQEWFESLILDAKKRLKPSERFVVVNAWNEWAEGAHLEPDCRYGYAYINSIGRALSGFEFSKREYLTYQVPTSTTLKLRISHGLLDLVAHDEWSRLRLVKCLEASSIWSQVQVFICTDDLKILPELTALANMDLIDAQYEYELIVNQFCLFQTDAISNMVRMAIFHGGCSVTPTHGNDPKFNHLKIDDDAASEASKYLYLRGFGNPALKCCVDAVVFISEPNAIGSVAPKISTILRFHRTGSIELLTRALYSLAAQTNCYVRPVIATQDLTPELRLALDHVLTQIPWMDICTPIIKTYTSNELNRDMRSLMLNDALRFVASGYVTFLDYDDVVFHDAYSWLAQRLSSTGKNAAFGIVYSTEYDRRTSRIGVRSTAFNYGTNYDAFVDHNHAPLHSFMLNLEKINLQKISFYHDMKYMEDYYLILQIFSEDNTDWESLQLQKFIGDYFHQIGNDSENTLALADDAKREQLLSNPEYKKCEDRIKKLRSSIKNT